MTEHFALPNPGAGRFWVGIHNPASEKTPLRLELREQTNSDPNKVLISFSRLIAKASTIADAKAVATAAEEILVRAGRVDEFVGILPALKEKAHAQR